MNVGPYAIGSRHLPGLSKLVEEIGEVAQVAGKIMGLGHMGEHWDGSNLKDRLEEEMADVGAAFAFFAILNGLDKAKIDERARHKARLFARWHNEAAFEAAASKPPETAE